MRHVSRYVKYKALNLNVMYVLVVHAKCYENIGVEELFQTGKGKCKH